MDSGLYDFEQGFIELVCRLAFQYDAFSSPDDIWNDCVRVVNEMANRLFQSPPPNRPRLPELVSTPGHAGGEESDPPLRVINAADVEEINRQILSRQGAAGPSVTTSGQPPLSDPPSRPTSLPQPAANEPLPPRPRSPLGPPSGPLHSTRHDTGDGEGPQVNVDSRLGGEEGSQADDDANNAPVDSHQGSKRPSMPSSSPSPSPPPPPTRASGRKRTAVPKWAPEPPSRSPKKHVPKRRRVQPAAQGQPANEPQEPLLSPEPAAPKAVERGPSGAAISPLLAMFPDVSGICAAPWVPKSLLEQDSEDLGKDDMDLGTPLGTTPGVNPPQFLQHKITMPTPQHMDGRLKLVEREFDFSYVKDPVSSSLPFPSPLAWIWLIIFCFEDQTEDQEDEVRGSSFISFSVNHFLSIGWLPTTLRRLAHALRILSGWRESCAAYSAHSTRIRVSVQCREKRPAVHGGDCEGR